MTDNKESKIWTEKRVTAEAIRALAHKEIRALRVPDYCDKAVCSLAMKRLSNEVGSGYRVEPNFRKFVGGALFDGADDDSDALEDYFSRAAEWYSACKEVFAPFLPPAHKMRLDLQEVWPAGTHLQRIGGRLAFAGLIRGFRDGAEARPHQDMTHWDLPQFEETLALKTQLSCLIYLSCAKSGGELELWDKEINDREEYDKAKVAGDYGLDRNRIGPSDASLSPNVGELIIFNARRIHAVRRIDEGLRYSQSFFLGYRGDDQPLTLFS